MRLLATVLLVSACSTPQSPPAGDDDGPPPDVAVDTESAAAFVYPRGCYTGVSALSPVAPAIYANPGIVGVSVSLEWMNLEAAGDNQFDWSPIDARIAEIEAHHQKVILSIVTSAAKAPDWLYALPGVTVMEIEDPNQNHGGGGQMIRVIPYWDPTFHAQKLEVIRAAGQRYGSDPNIIGVMTAFANYFTNDWGIPTDMVNADYNYAGMIAIGKDVLDATALAFPNAAVKLPLGKNDPTTDPDKTTTQMAADIVAFAQSRPWANRFFAQKNLINTMSPHADELGSPDPDSNDWLLALLRDMSPQMGLQMVASASGGEADGCRQNAHVSPCPPYDVLETSIDISLSYAPTYLEFWEADGKNASLYPLMQQATAAMQH